MIRGFLLCLVGLAMPITGFVVIGMTVRPAVGMDGYVPAFLGGMAGCVLAVLLVSLGLFDIIRALNARGRE